MPGIVQLGFYIKQEIQNGENEIITVKDYTIDSTMKYKRRTRKGGGVLEGFQ